MTWRILNTLDLSGAPEAVTAFQGVGELTSIPADREIVLDQIGKYDAYHASASVRIDRELLEYAPRLRLIGSPSTGTDHIDFDELRARSITCLDIAKEYELINSFTATSELAFGLLLALIRNIPQGKKAAEKGAWLREALAGFQLSGKTLGVLGLGRLGIISSRIAQGFGMRVIAHDVRNRDVEGVAMVDFGSLLNKSDVLTVHLHLNPTTDGLIDSNAFREMKRTAIIINTSRGRIIQEEALLEALDRGQIAGAALDVIDGEWLSEAQLFEHPLINYARDHDNLLIVPHIGGSTVESIYGARVFMARKMANVIRSWPRQAN